MPRLRSFGGNGFHVAEVEEGDISRIAELVEQYVSLPLGIGTGAEGRRQPGAGAHATDPYRGVAALTHVIAVR